MLGHLSVSRVVSQVERPQWVERRHSLLDRREPRQEPVMRLDRSGGALGIIRHRRHGLKVSDKGFALAPRGKEVKIQGVSVLPTRKPRLLFLITVVSQRRLAERRLSGPLNQEPPRMARRLQTPVVHAEPSEGAPL
jgi:hypothetical protein